MNVVLPSKPVVIGIRRENERKFEARVPLIPAHVAQLLAQYPGRVEVLVQPSPLRTFTDAAYEQAGATLQEDLSPADVILCVKELYPEQLLDDKTYLVFAHVIKGQPDNMPVLRDLLQRRITLIDYECITDEEGDRTVFFGRSAGQTGMLETLRALGHRLTALGYPCIFSQLKPVYEYQDLADALNHLATIATTISAQPHSLGITDRPLVFAVAGLGNVGKGALEILHQLPSQTVLPDQLPALFQAYQSPKESPGQLYICPLGKADVLRNGAGRFEAQDYAAHPDRYHSILPNLLPYISVLLNCVFYAPGYPRILPQEAFRTAWLQGDRCLQVIGDLSCDPPDGSVACTVQSGDLYHPIFGYNPATGEVCDPSNPFASDGVTVMAVDNLSAGLPKDASIAFSHMLMAVLPSLVTANLQAPDLSCELPPNLLRATVTHQGQLMTRYQYLQPTLAIHAG